MRFEKGGFHGFLPFENPCPIENLKRFNRFQGPSLPDFQGLHLLAVQKRDSFITLNCLFFHDYCLIKLN